MDTIKQLSLCILILFILHFPSLKAQDNATEEEHIERSYTYQERELAYLMTIWSGEYDNVEQLDFDGYLKKTTLQKGKHLRVHHFAQRIDLATFGDDVIYIEEYQNDDPNTISRQSIYSLTADEEANTIRLKMYHFVAASPQLSLGKKLSFLKGLHPRSERLKAACELLLQREGDFFKGKSTTVNCINTNNDFNNHYHMKIGPGIYEFNEIKYHKKTGLRLADEEQSTPYLLEKARCFSCMIDFPNKDNGRPTITKHYIKIHDQGGKFEFDYDDGRHMVLGMRNTWSLGMQRETFVIFIQENSQKGPTLIYSWGAPGADRIGFNPGWIRVQCDLDTANNRKLQRGLRPGS